MKRLLLIFSFLVCLAASLAAQDMASFEKRVTVKKLPNGLTVVICERHEAPVVSFFTHVNAGDAQDPKGQTGLAHMFEHMAFKGTDKIGTANWPAEKLALQRVEQAYQAYDRERTKEVGRDDEKIAAAKKAWEDATEKAQKYVVVNQFDEVLERNGAEGMNASTSLDETQYYYSLPSNRVELWAYMESERFLHPVMREFYKERDVVYEERRMRVDSSPIGRLVEQFQAASFVVHPYHNEGIGDASEITSFSATDLSQKHRGAPRIAEQAVETARNMSRHSMIEARRSVWDLRCHLLETGDLVSALRQIVLPLAPRDGQIEVRIEGEQVRLASTMEMNLLRIGQVLRHRELPQQFAGSRAERLHLARMVIKHQQNTSVGQDDE